MVMKCMGAGLPVGRQACWSSSDGLAASEQFFGAQLFWLHWYCGAIFAFLNPDFCSFHQE